MSCRVGPLNMPIPLNETKELNPATSSPESCTSDFWWHYKSDWIEVAGFDDGSHITLLDDGTSTRREFNTNPDWRPANYPAFVKRPMSELPAWANKPMGVLLDK
jgi:hypothetical protein